MPDPMLVLRSSAVAAAVAALILLAGSWPWRRPRTTFITIGGTLGLVAGLLAGAWALDLAPHFPPREDQDRLLLILLPAAAVVEIAAGFLQRMPWLAWTLRLVVAAGATRVLLHGSVYVMGDPGMRRWPGAEMWWILAGHAAALAATWWLLIRLGKRQAGRTVLLSLALASAGAGVAVMLSGYASGGQLGFPLAAGLAGVALASFLVAGVPDLSGSVGVGVVGLFALLVIGRFFGDLTNLNAVLLFSAPLLGWLPELKRLERIGGRLRGLTRIALTAVPVALVLFLAVKAFTDSAAPARPGAGESSDDYGNFGDRRPP
jgi:hypothetical protein